MYKVMSVIDGQEYEVAQFDDFGKVIDALNKLRSVNPEGIYKYDK